MSEIAISVRNVSKMYPLYTDPKDRLKQSLWHALPQAFRGQPRRFYREFWALRNISLEVKRGETVGIIGRNGSGKSTLLQIIAGTLAPSSGEVQVNGRVAALLELSSGFNPQFTGRENVYLNGAILGFSREEMNERFDQIAAFADIGEFIDQPVKLYSSGMFVRLAFAVQACVEPDVLIVDEALAVGDIFFRQKCYRRLEALRDQGVSILLVSHSMIDVEQFCQHVLLLEQGNPLFQGGASEAVKRYYLIQQKDHVKRPAKQRQTVASDKSANPSNNQDETWLPEDAYLDISKVDQISNGWAHCTGVAIYNSQGQPCRVFQQGETASFFYEFEVLQDIEVPIGGLTIQNDKGVIIHGKNTLQYETEVPSQVAQGCRLRFRQDITLEIAIGEYSFTAGLAMISRYDYEYRKEYSQADLNTKIIRLCHLPGLGPFTVALQRNGHSPQLTHHGIANLPGKCQVVVA